MLIAQIWVWNEIIQMENYFVHCVVALWIFIRNKQTNFHSTTAFSYSRHLEIFPFVLSAHLVKKKQRKDMSIEIKCIKWFQEQQRQNTHTLPFCIQRLCCILHSIVCTHENTKHRFYSIRLPLTVMLMYFSSLRLSPPIWSIYLSIFSS